VRVVRALLVGFASIALLAAPGVAQDADEEKPAADEAQPGFLGISMEPWTVPDSDPPRARVRVTAVVPSSAAARVGMQLGDLILAVDDEDMLAPPDEVLQKFGARIRGLGAGSSLKLRIRRSSVEVRTYVDDALQGEAQEASGPRATRNILPDLRALLEEHEEQLVTVRARAFSRQRELEVVLGSRPGAQAVTLPDNASLRPAWAERELVGAAALAERAIGLAQVEGKPLAAQYHDLLDRFEKDEGIEDPFRLKTVRFLHRAPLRLAGATQDLGAALRAVLDPEREGKNAGPPRLLDVARTQLDVGESRGILLPRPTGGASPEEHARFALACVEAADAATARALAGLSAEDREHLEATLPGLAEKFAEDIYLHTDEDTERWERHRRAIELLAKVDRGALLDALEALLPLATPGYLFQLRADLERAEREGTGRAGKDPDVRGFVLWEDDQLVVGSSQENEYRADRRVIIDLGGNDRYHNNAGGTRLGKAAVCIDLGGDDRYQTTAPFSQGAALLGAALLVDTSGDDHYTSNVAFAQGASLCGAALLLDLGGNDVYRGTTYAQGSALCQGLAALVDVGGRDLVSAGLYAQGFAGPGALGCLLTRGGDDHYSALGLAPCGYGDPGTYRAMSQGSSVGFRTQASGGIAVLLDDGGQDTYEAGNFSQGGGYYFGWGTLIDFGGEGDRYEGSRYAQGFAAHSALGSFRDEGGDDIYRGWVGAQVSAAWDLSVTSFEDHAGNDRYEPGPGFSIAASAHNGFSLFCDHGGRDRYKIAPGRVGPNDYHGGPSISVFVDAGGGVDQYAGGGLADDRASVHAQGGVLLDLPKAVEQADDELLQGLFER